MSCSWRKTTTPVRRGRIFCYHSLIRTRVFMGEQSLCPGDTPEEVVRLVVHLPQPSLTTQRLTRSRTTLLGSLSSLMPTNLMCRTWCVSVHSRNSKFATSSGFTQTHPFIF